MSLLRAVLLGFALGSAACVAPEAEFETEEDRRITLEVRRVVAGVEASSGHAERVQVVTREGVVKLLGPVSTGDEKALLGGLVQNVRGVRRVDNQLEIVPGR